MNRWILERSGVGASRLSRLGPCAAMIAAAAVVAGCESEERHVGAPTANAARAPRAPRAAPKVPAAPKMDDSTFIVGRRTQDIKNAQNELEGGQARVASTKIVAKDPITLPGNAYVTIVGRTSMLNIQHALDLYNASNGRYPQDYDEFMNEIIKANNIALPQLPYYQKYGYDAPQHKLIVLEYPH